MVFCFPSLDLSRVTVQGVVGSQGLAACGGLEGVEWVDGVFAGGGEVGPDGGEGGGSGEGSHAAGDFLFDLDHADFLFGGADQPGTSLRLWQDRTKDQP